MKEKGFRVNYAIRSPRVRLILNDGTQKGIIDVKEAQRLANNAGLDLVEVSPNVQPPVCKLLDYGKYKFEMEKRDRASRKNSKTTKLKEIRVQPKIDKHDLEFKMRHMEQFLQAGNKVKVTIRFRGRELAHTELGEELLKKIVMTLDGISNIDKKPSVEGRFMSMILSPHTKR